MEEDEVGANALSYFCENLPLCRNGWFGCSLAKTDYGCLGNTLVAITTVQRSPVPLPEILQLVRDSPKCDP